MKLSEAEKPLSEQERLITELQTMKSLPDGLFADYALTQGESGKQKRLESLKKYAPKIITIQETQRFWQMYKAGLSSDQVQILQNYVQSHSSYLDRQRFLAQTRK